MPIDPEFLRLEFAKRSAEVAANSALSLAELGLLPPERSQEIENSVRVMADLARSAGGEIAETVFLRLANEIAHWRDALPPPEREPD